MWSKVLMLLLAVWVVIETEGWPACRTKQSWFEELRKPHCNNNRLLPAMIIYRSNRVLLASGVITPAGILVNEKGSIVKIIPGEKCENYATMQGIEVVDYGNLVIMPGVVDSHVHVNEPGRTTWEGFTTATRAAAAGGITTIIDMPLNAIPPTTTVENLKTKLAAAQGKVHVDVGFWGGLIPGNQDDIIPLVEAGVVGFKSFLAPSGVDEFPNVTPEDVEIALQKLKGTNSVLAFHAELDLHLNYSHSHPEKYDTYLDSKPPETEIEAIKLVIDLATKYNVRTHIVHLSASGALPMLREAREKDPQISVETCHHYLTLSAEEVPDNHTEYKCSPPIRPKSNQEALWTAIKEGHIDMVVSDHSPSTPDVKTLCCGLTPDFLKAWGGIASVQFGLSLFWTGAKAHGLNLHDVTRFLSSTPAKLVGLQNVKGTLKEGFDADLVVWDPEEEILIETDMIEFKNKATPYLGRKFLGKVHHTIVRGQVVFENGQVVEDPLGKLLLHGSK